jgi:hypothetical protein
MISLFFVCMSAEIKRRVHVKKVLGTDGRFRSFVRIPKRKDSMQEWCGEGKRHEESLAAPAYLTHSAAILLRSIFSSSASIAACVSPPLRGGSGFSFFTSVGGSSEYRR